MPDLKFNLLSVSQAAKLGKKAIFDKHECKFIDSGTNKCVLIAKKEGSLYYVDCTSEYIGKVEADKVEAVSRKQDKNDLQRERMKEALRCIKENNFEEEIIRRFSKVNKYKIKEDEAYLNQEDTNGHQSQEDTNGHQNQDNVIIDNDEDKQDEFPNQVDHATKIKRRGFRQKVVSFKKLCRSKFGRK